MPKKMSASAIIIMSIFLSAFLANFHASTEDSITHEYKVTPTNTAKDKEKQAYSIEASELVRLADEARVALMRESTAAPWKRLSVRMNADADIFDQR